MERHIEAALLVAATEWGLGYELSPEKDRMLWGAGTGTTSALNQLAGEIYRDAGMRLVRLCWQNAYVFRDIDYSEQHYDD